MQAYDIAVFVVLAVVCVIYGAVGGRPLRGKVPLLTGASAVAFEVVEIIVLAGLVLYGVHDKELGFAAVFLVALVEHIRQVTVCERQASYGPRNVITLVEFLLLIILSSTRGVWWATTAFLIGALIHTYMLVTRRPFINVVCFR